MKHELSENEIKEEIGLIRNIIEESVIKQGTEKFKRFHRKGYGLLEGEFVINKDLDERFVSSLFQPGKTYKCRIRFSHGAPKIKPDNKRGSFGIAVKLLDIGHEVFEKDFDKNGNRTKQNHDFLLTNNPVLYPGTLKRFRYSMEFLFFGKVKSLIKLILSNVKTFIAFALFPSKEKSLLHIEYFSGLPYKLNDYNVKLKVLPSKAKLLENENAEPNTRLLDNLRFAVEEQNWELEFGCQVQGKPEKELIDNAEIPWKGEFNPIAKIRILRDSLDESEVGNQMSFNPWHCSVEHEPLGALSQARKLVYKAMTRVRKKANGNQKAEY